VVVGPNKVDGSVGKWQACVCLWGHQPDRGHLCCCRGSVRCHCDCLGLLIGIVLLSPLVPAHVVPEQEIAFDNPSGIAVVDGEAVLEYTAGNCGVRLAHTRHNVRVEHATL
jgi:hypothetical protein